MKVKLHIVDAAETLVVPGGEKLVEPAISVMRKKKPKFHLGGRISSSYPFPLWSSVSGGHKYFPTGLIPHVVNYLKEKKIEVEIIHSDSVVIEYNSIVKYETVDPTLLGITWRPDQLKLLRYVAEAQRGVIKSATGTGKTLLQLGIVNMFPGARFLLLAHLEGIVSQTFQDATQAYGMKSVQMVEGSKDIITEDFVISTIQSFYRMADRYVDYFDGVIVDECFPKGTLIDKKDIELYSDGDIVTSLNHQTGKVEKKKITHVFKSKPKSLVTIKLVNGKEITCTGNHPIYTRFYGADSTREYTPAQWLKVGYEMLSMSQNSNEGTYCPTEKKGSKNRAILLLQRVYQRIFKRNVISNHEKNQSKILFGKNEEKKSHAQKGNSRKSFQTTQGNGALPKNTMWKWSWSFRSTTSHANSSEITKPLCRISNSNKSRAFKWSISKSLQIGHCINTLYDWCGSRWKFPWYFGTTKTRCEERPFLKWIRVESIKIHQQTSDGTFGGMCPDGYVYNLEVEENSNYFPEGFLVHNCHHLNTLTGMYGKTMQKLLSPIRLGFTATLPNTPEGNLVMTGYTGPVIGEFSIDDAVEEGVLAKPRIRLLKIPDNLKVGDLRTYKEVYDQGIVNNNARNRKIVSLIMQYSKEGKSVLVFVNQILHGDQICILAWKFGLKVHFVQGETPKEMRAELKERLKNKTVDAIIATAVWKEGVNVPSLDVVINAGGGKSEIQTLQIIGRGLRKSDGKKEVLIIDFFDPSHRYLVDHFGHRLCLYFDNGWLGKD